MEWVIENMGHIWKLDNGASHAQWWLTWPIQNEETERQKSINIVGGSWWLEQRHSKK